MSVIQQMYCTHCTHGSSALERRQGDLAARMLGYSVRAGSLEGDALRQIYRQVEHFEEIVDAVCVGQEWQDDVRVVLFVIMRPGEQLTDDLVSAVKLRIRNLASPRHTPAPPPLMNNPIAAPCRILKRFWSLSPIRGTSSGGTRSPRFAFPWRSSA